MADLSFSSIQLCWNVYTLPELNKVTNQAGLSVGDQYVVSKAINTSSVVAVCSCNFQPSPRILRERESFCTRPCISANGQVMGK